MTRGEKKSVALRIPAEDFARIAVAIGRLLTPIYQYNSAIKHFGYYLKPVHVVSRRSDGNLVKYYYYGRYWYRLDTSSSKLKWIYIGRNKPDPSLPDPPPHELEGLVVKKSDGFVEFLAHSEDLLEKIYVILKSKPAKP